MPYPPQHQVSRRIMSTSGRNDETCWIIAPDTSMPGTSTKIEVKIPITSLQDTKRAVGAVNTLSKGVQDCHIK